MKLKPKVSRYEGVYQIGNLSENISRWLGTILIGIGEGNVRGAIYNIWDEIHEQAYTHGYNSAIKEMEDKQPKLPETS